jgi:hypothetical protein
MQKIFALQGASNCGKTTTLNLLYNQICTKYSVVGNFKYSGKDICVEVTIIINGKSVTIGIETQGDPNSRLCKSLAYFNSINCDIIFCACRTRGGTVGCVKSMNPPYAINFIKQKCNNHLHVANNTEMVSRLMLQAGI